MQTAPIDKFSGRFCFFFSKRHSLQILAL